MSQGVSYLHSHSGLEREMKMKKQYVLVDVEFMSEFEKEHVTIQPFYYDNVNYIKVPTITFVKLGGAFKNLMK